MNAITNNINSPVTVTAIGFDRAMHAYPRRIEWQGEVYDFVDSGLRVRRGRNHNGSVTMSDGKQNFCFTKKAGAWTLIGIY